jgi:muconolactone D-isomerase
MPTSRTSDTEYLVEFVVQIPEGTPRLLVRDLTAAEATAAANLAERGHLIRLWKIPGSRDISAIGLYRTRTRAELDALLAGLPLYDWMRVTVTTLESHPNDPGSRC